MQLLVLLALDSMDEGSRPLQSDLGAMLFALALMVEAAALIALSMYRFSPWIAHFLGDEWEANRIKGDRHHVPFIMRLSAAMIILLRTIQAVDGGSVTPATLLGVAFALLPFLVPSPKKNRVR